MHCFISVISYFSLLFRYCKNLFIQTLSKKGKEFVNIVKIAGFHEI